jgi:imidazolonepropionase-like amidohydrolase
MVKNQRFKLILGLIFTTFISFAQSDPKIEVTKTYLIKNAWVVSKPGAVPSLQSILIKNGIINQISTTIKVPFDAKTIDVDSMYLYAGFIDPMSHTGIKKEEEKKDAPKPASRGVATFEQSGITPQVTALSKFSIKESSIADMRKAGFTVSHIFPRGKMIGGQSAIISLKDADHEDKLIIAQNVGMHSSFTTASGVVPSTVIAVIAKFRDVYKNTELAIKNLQTYNLNPTGLKRPTYSEELTALFPVSKKEMPVYFVAEKSKDVFRAISLQKELGYKMILSDVKQSQHALSPIKSGGYSVLLSMDIPDEIKDETKKEEPKKDDKSKEDSKKVENLTKDESQKEDSKKEEKKKDEPKKVLTAEEKELNEKKKKSYDEYNQQAGILEKNTIPFSFSYLEIKTSDIHKNIKRLIKSGLSETAALAALTTTPANMLGLSKTNGTIEVGKIANLVLTDKPLFEEKSELKYVMVEGNLYDYQEKKKSDAKIDEKGAKIEGTWSFSVEIPGQTQKGKLIFEKDGAAYKGTSETDSSPGEIDKLEDIAIEADKVTFTMTADLGQPTTVNFDLLFTADGFSGSVIIPSFGTFPIKGSKISGPKF